MIVIEDYVYLVPFIESEEELFLKQLFQVGKVSSQTSVVKPPAFSGSWLIALDKKCRGKSHSLYFGKILGKQPKPTEVVSNE